jgi:hypothetical protein
MTFLYGTLAASVIAAGLIWLAPSRERHAGAIVDMRPNPSAIRDLLATTSSSPLGQQTFGVSVSAALRTADRFLHETRDTAEAAFWLRYALSLPLDEASIRWALTQLGTVYATLQPSPDFNAAERLWHEAAALGDTVALCFLAASKAHGLATIADRTMALALYRRAEAGGGCADAR